MSVRIAKYNNIFTAAKTAFYFCNSQEIKTNNEAVTVNSGINRQLKNKIISLRAQLRQKKRKLRQEKLKNYVENIFQTFLKEKKNFASAIQELEDMSPQPMNSMLVKQSKEDAIAKERERRSMATKDVPPTNEPVPPQPVPTTDTSARAKPHCNLCKHPMKGHKMY